ncbi:MAG: hypothetical protein MUO52_06835 [Desulfobacterales bacterium]|nr:hypothetical protein [Desulfobacterales bacterium]
MTNLFRNLASLWLEGNAAPTIPARRGDDALLVDQASLYGLDRKCNIT